MYKVKDIIEPDFGCEGIPDGEQLCCEVVIEDIETGVLSTVIVPDEELYGKCIVEGCKVTFNNGVIVKEE